ncbi:MAG: M48 family metallopeptidase [Nitratireductor sp.]|nr:M48 family metallopeptidase [Nitratireductor sp.]
MPRKAALAGCLAGALAANTQSVLAQGKGTRLALVRDAEIEALLKDYTTPIFRAAGFGQGAVDVYLLNDDTYNAFVTGRRMFINTGAIQTAETPNEIIGVLAHEAGHIMGGHQFRLRDRVEKAKILGALSMLAGIGATALGGDAASAAGSALALGSQSSLTRDLLSYRREEEIAADNTAIKLLDKTQQSGRGMLTTFERFSQKLLFSGSRVDPYLQSHPMPRERIALLETIIGKSPYVNAKDSPALQLRHDMARAKIAAYTGRAGEIQVVTRDDPQGPAARYGIAISMYLHGSNAKALPILDGLIREQPKNPYLYEIKGEILLSSGKAREAVESYRKAVQFDPYKTGLIRVQLGHAMLETYDRSLANSAIVEIKAGLSRDPTNSRGYGLLARAYSAMGNEDMARSAAAEEAYYALRVDDAKRLANLAQPKLKRGTPEWLRMQDIIDYKPPKK